MDSIARFDGSNEFFARRALYNASVKLRRGDDFRARKFCDLALTCQRAGGVSSATANRISEMKNSLEARL
jgi:hypothetical protein